MYAAVSVGFTAFTLTFSDFFGKLKVFHRRMHSFDVVIVSYPLGIKNSLLWLFYYTIGGLFCHCPFLLDLFTGANGVSKKFMSLCLLILLLN